MTVINAAWRLVNALIDRKDVKRIDFGRIVVAKGGREWQNLGVRCVQKGRELHLTCTESKAMQFITATFLVGTDLQSLSNEIHERGFEFSPTEDNVQNRSVA